VRLLNCKSSSLALAWRFFFCFFELFFASEHPQTARFRRQVEKGKKKAQADKSST